ncbi:MAG: hypothetical protein JEZ12_03785 [Desulfobacterium sp.]|nr:hypothetical protein [Desulfobacterium sp.]
MQASIEIFRQAIFTFRNRSCIRPVLFKDIWNFLHILIQISHGQRQHFPPINKILVDGDTLFRNPLAE